MSSKIVSMQNVAFGYDAGGYVLQNINLNIEQGAFMAVIGPNGGGKTTLIKLMLGLLRPQLGTVRVMGDDPSSSSPSVGYVPQNTVAECAFPITVMDVVLLGVPRAERPLFGASRRLKEQAMLALERVDMAQYAGRRCDQLSGGQRQRTLIARAIVSSPKLLLFDEPTSNIDPHGKVCLFDLMAELSETLTVVVVSHDLISASMGINQVAAVNRHLLHGDELTPEMLELVYGVHDETCPLDGYLKSLSGVFEQGRGGRRD